MTRAKVYNPAAKSINAWNVDSDVGWSIIGGQTGAPESELVPVVSACIDERAKGVMDLPFAVYDQRGDMIDDSDDYKNVTGLIPNPHLFLCLTEMSLVMSGQAYWGKRSNVAGYAKQLQYWAIGTTSPQIQPTTNADNLTFRRTNVAREIPARDVFYVWGPDARVEFGPPTNYPLKRALKSAGALSAISAFIDNYMNSGMVRAFIAQNEMPPVNPDERGETEDYLTRILTGVRSALSRVRVLGKGWTFTTVGGGLDELKNVAIVKEIKQDVLEAFGVKASRIWGNAANYATAANDTLVFVTNVIMPDARLIQGAINEQLFKPYGYTWQFEPRRMEEFGIILSEKMTALEGVIKVLEPILGKSAALIAAIDIMGIDISPTLKSQIEQAQADEQAKQAVAAQTPSPAPLPAPEPTPEPVQEPAPDIPPAVRRALVELDKWQAKSEKAGKLVTWHAVDLPAAIVDAVKGGAEWETAREIVRGDAHPPVIPAPAPDQEIKALADALNRAADAYTAKAVTQPASPPIWTVNLTANMPQPGEQPVTINIPEQPAPIVNVNIPEQPAPVVNVSTPAQPAPVVNVTAVPGETRLIMPAPKPVEVIRDSNGLAKEIRPK